MVPRRVRGFHSLFCPLRYRRHRGPSTPRSHDLPEATGLCALTNSTPGSAPPYGVPGHDVDNEEARRHPRNQTRDLQNGIYIEVRAPAPMAIEWFDEHLKK